MTTVRVVMVLDGSGEVRLPLPVEFHAGEFVEVEAIVRNASEIGTAPEKSWSEWLDAIEGLFESSPLELPVDSH